MKQYINFLQLGEWQLNDYGDETCVAVKEESSIDDIFPEVEICLDTETGEVTITSNDKAKEFVGEPGEKKWLWVGNHSGRFWLNTYGHVENGSAEIAMHKKGKQYPTYEDVKWISFDYGNGEVKLYDNMLKEIVDDEEDELNLVVGSGNGTTVFVPYTDDMIFEPSIACSPSYFLCQAFQRCEHMEKLGIKKTCVVEFDGTKVVAIHRRKPKSEREKFIEHLRFMINEANHRIEGPEGLVEYVEQYLDKIEGE